MTKDRTKKITDWVSLVEFVESINPHRKTIVLTGWVNQLYKGRTYVRELIFSTKDVSILKEKKQIDTGLKKKPKK